MSFLLRELPEKARQLGGAVPELHRLVARASLERALVGRRRAAHHLYALTRMAYRWRIVLTKEGEEIVFFIWRRALPAQLVMDLDVQACLAPVDYLNGSPRLAPENVRLRISHPSLLVPRPTLAQVRAYGADGATRRDTVLFRIGPGEADALAITKPDAGLDGAKLVHTRGAAKRVYTRETGFPIRPVAELLAGIGRWAASAGRSDPSLVASLPADPSEEPLRVLRRLVEAYCALADAVEPVAAPDGYAAPPRLREALRTTFGIDAFEAAVSLRLKADGTLAVKDDDDPFVMRLAVVVDPASTPPTARVSVRPPDFLVSGALHQAFLVLLEDEALESLARALFGAAGLDERAAARRFLGSLEEPALIFRTERKSRARDIDVVVMRGRAAGATRLLVARGAFRVDRGEDQPRVRLLGELSRLYLGPPGSMADWPDARAIEQLLRLATLVRDWYGALE